MKKFYLLMMGVTFSFNVFSASELIDCSNKDMEVYFLLGGLSKKLQADLKDDSPRFIKEFNKSANMKGPAGSKAMDMVVSSISCTFFAIKEGNFFSMTFKNKNDKSDYQLEFSPAGGYRSWVASSKGKTEQCYYVRVLNGGFPVKDPKTNEAYTAYALADAALGTKVVDSCQ